MLVSVTQCWLVIMMAINKSVMKSPIRTLLLSFFGGWSLANDPLLPLCLRATCSSFFQRLIFSHSRRWMVRVNGGRRLLNRPFASVPDLLLIAGNYRPWFCFLRLLLFSLSVSLRLLIQSRLLGGATVCFQPILRHKVQHKSFNGRKEEERKETEEALTGSSSSFPPPPPPPPPSCVQESCRMIGNDPPSLAPSSSSLPASKTWRNVSAHSTPSSVSRSVAPLLPANIYIAAISNKNRKKKKKKKRSTFIPLIEPGIDHWTPSSGGGAPYCPASSSPSRPESPPAGSMEAMSDSWNEGLSPEMGRSRGISI